MNNHVDERTTGTAQRWAARGYVILSFALSIDIMVRILILKQEPQQYLDVSLIWVATMLFVSLGATASGVAPYEGKWSQAGLLIVIISVTVPGMLTLMGTVHTAADFLTKMVLAAASAFLGLMILRVIFALWERRTLGRASRDD